MPPMRAGELDGRYIDFRQDLGTIEDQISSVNDVTIAIKRRDGFPMTVDDLALAGTNGDMELDATNLILTFWLNAPSASGGSKYRLTVTIDTTMQGRLRVRDVNMDVLSLMG